ncbi:uncharacterized protein TNCV_2097301 [Trichonephila clavipes]|nr:uncharacterized protein TNCV_2097301 [Trichonephila clavipes]
MGDIGPSTLQSGHVALRFPCVWSTEEILEREVLQLGRRTQGHCEGLGLVTTTKILVTRNPAVCSSVGSLYSDVEKYGYKAIFEPLIQDLKQLLDHGIEFRGNTYKIALWQILASNFSSVPTSDSTVPPCNTDITYSCINDSLTIFPHPVCDISDLDASDEQWFSPGVRGAPATGFIADRFKNFRARNLSVVEKEELGIGQIKKNIKEKIIKYQGTEDSSVEFLQKQQWLKENTSPPDKVLLLMQETFEGRRFEISRNATNFVSLDPHVIEAEFNMLYGEQKSDSLCLGFGMTANLIIHQAKHCGRKCAEEFANSLNFDLDSTEPSSEKICCALTLLPLLLPQRVFRRNGPKKLKIHPTSSQTLDHFIQFIPVGEGIDMFMKDDRLLGGERRQPFILAIGEKCRPQQLFLIFEENCIEWNGCSCLLEIRLWREREIVAVDSLVVRAPDSRPEGLGSMPVPPNTPKLHTEYVLVKSVGPKLLWAESRVQGTGENFPPLQFHA